MTRCHTPVLVLTAVLVIALVTCLRPADDVGDVGNTIDKLNRHRRQILVRTFNNTEAGNTVYLGSASLSVEEYGSYEDLYPWLLSQQLNNQTNLGPTTTTQPPTTTSGGRDLTQACTCIGGRCVTFQEIFDLCLSTVRNSDTCLANLDLLCENVKTQSAG
ncbi:uncharacterized protein LOC135476088 [Liolophura sinensis]|uniref:uncharacterized protein LOC135476088 n=1 Tax=Liolophura sinensis TaxID=3198878 RepID=UPI003159272F